MEQPQGKPPARTPTSWDAEDDALLMHLKDQQKLGWKEIASHFANRTPNACQFRWRRLKLGNLKNPPKLVAQAAAAKRIMSPSGPLSPLVRSLAETTPIPGSGSKLAASTGHLGTPSSSSVNNHQNNHNINSNSSNVSTISSSSAAAAVAAAAAGISASTAASIAAVAAAASASGTNTNNTSHNQIHGNNASSGPASSNLPAPFGVSQLPFTGYDNNVNNALAGLNALLNTPSQALTPSSFTPQHPASPSQQYGSPLDPPPHPPRGPHTGGGYYAEISVDPTMNLPQNQPHPPVNLTSRRNSASPETDHQSGQESSGNDHEPLVNRRNSTVDLRRRLFAHTNNNHTVNSGSGSSNSNSIGGASNGQHQLHQGSTSSSSLIHPAAQRRVSTVLQALHNNLIIQIAKDDRASISSMSRASVLSLPLKLMNIPHHQLGNNALAHLPVLFGGAGGSISGPSPTPSISGPPGIHLKEVALLRSSSVGLVSNSSGGPAHGHGPGYFLRLGSVVIPYNGEKRIEAEKNTPERKKEIDIGDKLKTLQNSHSHSHTNSSSSNSNTNSSSSNSKKSIFKLPWSMEEDELLINRRNRELSFAELLILLPQRTEGEIWSRIDQLEKLSTGRSRDVKRRQSLIGLDDVDGFYDVIDSDEDEDDDVLLDVDEGMRRKKRRASSAVNPLGKIR